MSALYTYSSFEQLIFGRIQNGYLDLRGIFLTNFQLEKLQDYIYTNKLLRFEITRITIKDLTIVNDIEDSSVIENGIVEIDSPYYRSLYIYHILSDMHLKCKPDLNLHDFRKGYNL